MQEGHQTKLQIKIEYEKRARLKMNTQGKVDNLRKEVEKLTIQLKQTLQIITMKRKTLKINQEHTKEQPFLSRWLTFQVQTMLFAFTL
jgi:hypothetical protein